MILTMILSVLVTLLIAIFCDIVIARASGVRMHGYLTSLLLSVVFAPIFLLTFSQTGFDLFLVIITVAIGLMSWFIYLNIAQAVESSLRIRILFELSKNGGAMADVDLYEIYNDASLIMLRIERLKEHKAITFQESRWHLNSPNLKKIAFIFTILKSLITGRTSQFDRTD